MITVRISGRSGHQQAQYLGECDGRISLAFGGQTYSYAVDSVRVISF
jgi:hypothetical protein